MTINQVISVRTSTGVIEVCYKHDPLTSLAQEVTISINGVPLGSNQSKSPYPDGVLPSSVDIWQKYQHAHYGNFVVRNGFGLCGCYGNDYTYGDPPNYLRQESDTEHACGCVELINNLSYHYPALLSSYLYERAEILLKNHDLGENSCGDIPDDGNQDPSSKNRNELENFVAVALHLPVTIRQNLVADFIRFQDPLFPDYPPAISRMIQLAKAVDKIEAVLSAILREKLSHRGDLTFKNTIGGISVRDQAYIDAIGSSTVVDVWLAHAVHQYHMCYGFPYLLDIVKAAVLEVRGA